MLTAGAAEGDLEVRELALDVFFDGLGDDGVDVIEELVDCWFFLKEGYDGGVFACIGSLFWIAAGIGERAAVEDKASAVARGIGGQPFLIGEAENRNGEGVGRDGGMGSCGVVKL